MTLNSQKYFLSREWKEMCCVYSLKWVSMLIWSVRLLFKATWQLLLDVKGAFASSSEGRCLDGLRKRMGTCPREHRSLSNTKRPGLSFFELPELIIILKHCHVVQQTRQCPVCPQLLLYLPNEKLGFQLLCSSFLLNSWFTINKKRTKAV